MMTDAFVLQGKGPGKLLVAGGFRCELRASSHEKQRLVRAIRGSKLKAAGSGEIPRSRASDFGL
jgi:hypothetical protein